MTQFTLATVVEGHGEVGALPLLLRQLRPAWNISQPVKGKRQLLVKENVPKNLEHYLRIARANFKECNGAIIVVIDADDDCPATLGPALLNRAIQVVPDIPVSVVLAMQEFEAWFIAGNAVAYDRPDEAEQLASPKAKVKAALGGIYSETVDMPKLIYNIDIVQARSRAPSFDKFLRSIESFDQE